MHIQSLVGYTSSKKAIYQYDTSDPDELSEKITGYSQEEHFDAVAVFSYLQLLYWRKYGEDSQDFKSATRLHFLHSTLTTHEFRQQYAIQLGIITAFDLAKYGRKHCTPYLQQLLDI
jgi:hypothetical protein